MKIDNKHHFIIRQFVRYKMASKMAAKIVHLNESNPKYNPDVINCAEGHTNGKLKPWSYHQYESI